MTCGISSSRLLTPSGMALLLLYLNQHTHTQDVTHMCIMYSVYLALCPVGLVYVTALPLEEAKIS